MLLRRVLLPISCSCSGYECSLEVSLIAFPLRRRPVELIDEVYDQVIRLHELRDESSEC